MQAKLPGLTLQSLCNALQGFAAALWLITLTFDEKRGPGSPNTIVLKLLQQNKVKSRFWNWCFIKAESVNQTRAAV